MLTRWVGSATRKSWWSRTTCWWLTTSLRARGGARRSRWRIRRSYLFADPGLRNLRLVRPPLWSAIPAVFLQAGEKVGAHARRVTGLRVAADVIGLSHADNGGAD